MAETTDTKHPPARKGSQEHSDGFSRRIRFGRDQRRTFRIAGARNKREADEIADELQEMALSLTEAGYAAEGAVILNGFAQAELDSERERHRGLVNSLCTATLRIDTAKIDRAGTTFRKLGKRWTSGDLAEDFPDHVPTKKTSELDEARLEKISAVKLPSGGTFGDLTLSAVTLDHCELVMRSLPETAKRPATRRQYAQVIRRVLELAVYPCRIIERHPLPRTFMPKVGKAPGFPYLYPDEDLALLKCDKVPLAYRMLWGFLAREGCRVSEALQLRVGGDLDLIRGAVSLDKNKTDDARTWALDVGVVRALSAWTELRGCQKGDLVFTDESRRPHETDKLAERLRAHLVIAKVTRDELHTNGTNKRQLRAHDLRGTFITLSLANDRSETWVADRTGHKSSIMINRYRRSARSAKELELGELTPLDDAIPELAEAQKEGGGGQRGGQRALATKSAAEEPIINQLEIMRCRRSGSNRHVFLGQRILSPPRLPVPPLRLVVGFPLVNSGGAV
jgi:integrase